jgi:2-dehydropantoate 2-reductase
MSVPTWHIAGIGAIGTLFAASFGQRADAVNVILKNNHQLAVYEHYQLSVITEKTTYTAHPRAINLEQIDEPIHYLLCCVKAYDATQLIMRLKPNLHKNSIIILMHNGLGVLDELKHQLPQLRIIFGLTTIGAYLEKPFSVRAFLDGAIYLGGVSGEFTTDEITMICSAFQAANLPCSWEEDIHNKLWEKFAVNCSINLLTVLHACKNGELRHHNNELKTLTQEIAHVLNAYDMPVTPDALFNIVMHIITITANNYSSMYQDVRKKKQTELCYLNEHLVKLAQQKNIAVPFNTEILNQFYTKFEAYP